MQQRGKSTTVNQTELAFDVSCNTDSILKVLIYLGRNATESRKAKP